MIALSSLKVFSFAIGFCLPTYLYFILLLKDNREEKKRLSILLHDLNNSIHDLSLWIESSTDQNEQSQILKLTINSLRNIVVNHFDPIENKTQQSHCFLSIGDLKKAFTFLARRHIPNVNFTIKEGDLLDNEGFINLKKTDSYRILMNLITNIKNAKATKLELALKLDNKYLSVTIINDFTQTKSPNREGLGLESIRSLIKINNGEYLSSNTDEYWQTQLQLKVLNNSSKANAA